MDTALHLIMEQLNKMESNVTKLNASQHKMQNNVSAKKN
jgi:hypothetical protein